MTVLLRALGLGLIGAAAIGLAAQAASLRQVATIPEPGLESYDIGIVDHGKYYLAEVRHVFDGKGLRTEFTAERAGLGKPQ